MLFFASIYCVIYVNRDSITHGGKGGDLENSVYLMLQILGLMLSESDHRIAIKYF